MKIIFLDTETTGFASSGDDRIVEIAAIAYSDLSLVPSNKGETFHQYLNPQRDMPWQAQEVHGLSEAFLADKPIFADIADNLIDFIYGNQLIMHNARFDAGFLNAELQRLRKPPLDEIVGRIDCSIVWSRNHNPGLSSHKLDALCRHYRIDLSERDYHGALIDARLLSKVCYHMWKGD